MTAKYDFQLDLEVENNSHNQLIQRIPRGARVLELGCATGYMSETLRKQFGCTVVGVEYDREAAAEAESRCDRVIVADLEDPAWFDSLDGERFDVITCADVIEHLRGPLPLLVGLREHLEPEGVLLASIPNSAHASVRLDLLEGRFAYEETGILDRTHLHQYTYDGVGALFAAAGYRVGELTYTFHDLADSVIRERLARVGLEPSERTFARLHAPDAAAYQFIVSARPIKEGEEAASYPELPDSPLEGSMEVYRNLLAELHETRVTAQTRETMVEERDAALARQHAALTDRNAQFAAQAEVLAARDAHIDRLGQLLEEKKRQSTEQIGRLRQELSELHREQGRLQQQLAAHSKALQAMQNSRGWRAYMFLMLPVRGWRRLKPYLAFALRNPGRVPGMFKTAWFVWRAGGLAAVRHRLAAAGTHMANAESPDYEAWIRRYEAVTPQQRREMDGYIESLDQPLVISILMPVHNVAEGWLRRALDSVLDQIYPYWELCIADDASTEPHVRNILEAYQGRDKRIKVVFREENGHISAASNSALALAGGDYVAFMDHDDLLSEYALYHVAREVAANPDAQLIYSDEDKLDAKGNRFAHYFKPDFNPDLMLSHNMICHLAVYRRSLLEEIGGFREGYEGAQDYDLALRALARIEPGQIRHIPRILYHWRAIAQSTASGSEAKPYAVEAAVKTVTEYLAGRGVHAKVTESPFIDGMLRVEYPLPDPPPLVSMLIPTRNGLELVRRCIESIRLKTEYQPYEIVVVDNDSDDPETLEYLEGLAAEGGIRLVRYGKPFNFSAINNFAAEHARGEVLAFLNNDLEVISEGWLGEMVSHAVRPEIGAVGACLWYPDDRLQHGGVVLGLGGVAGHAMKMLPRGIKGYNARAVLVQNYSAVTAACMLIRREVFEQVGGFDAENLPVAFNDVDFSLRVREKGYWNLWTPYAQLYHHESASRGPEDTPEKQARFKKEIAYMRRRWGALLRRDPAYNPNLTDRSEDFSLR